MKARLIHDLSRILPSSAVHEHSALHLRGSVTQDVGVYLVLGYEVCHTTDTAAFLQRGKHRLELVPHDILEHEAWAVPTRDSFESLLDGLGHGFEFVGKVHRTDELLNALLRHTATKDVIQIIWRKAPIFRDVFEDAH